MDENDPWLPIKEPFVRAFHRQAEALKMGETAAGKAKIQANEQPLYIRINRSRLLQARLSNAGNSRANLLQDAFCDGAARRLAESGDELRRHAQLPQGALSTA